MPALALFFLIGMLFRLEAAETNYAASAQLAYSVAKARFEEPGAPLTNAWLFAKAVFEWAEFATNDTQRAALANEGIAACRRQIEAGAVSAPAHYYLALNLAQLARTKSLGALRLVREMERELKSAAALDASFRFAGPVRTLGMLYANAPGWPASIGSLTKARQYLERAVELAPGNPDNHLALIESYVKWGLRNLAREAAQDYETRLPQSRLDYSGPDWEADWSDWNTRWMALRPKTGLASPTP